MTLAQFLDAAADAVLAMEPEPMEPYASSGLFEAIAEAQQHAQEARQ